MSESPPDTPVAEGPSGAAPAAATPLLGVVVCHGRLSEALVGAVEQISGLHGALVGVSNTGCDRQSLEQRIEAAVGPLPAVVFVDMAAGSCMVAVLRRLRERGDVKVVTGVNLAMLVDFVFHRDATPAEAARRAQCIGEQAIRVPT
jgi:mannose/fructose-specific phosphotransferase system component IIA